MTSKRSVRGLLCFAALAALGLLASCASSPAKSFVYVSLAEENRIRVYALDASGELSHRQDVDLDGDPGALTVSPDRRLVFASFRLKGQIASFRLDPGSGELTQVGLIDAAVDPAFLSCDRRGRFLLSAYYVDGKAAVHPIREDGTLDAVRAQWVTTTARAHAIETDVANRFAFVPHTKPNRIFQFRFDEETGKLTPNDPASVDTGQRTGPRHSYVHPSRPFVYFDNEQGSSVTAFRLDPEKGTLTPFQTLSTLPESFAESNSCARLDGTRSGRFLYAGNRGHDSLAGFEIDPDSGRLTSLGQFETEKTPRGFDIDPTDHFVVAAGQSSNRLATFRILGNGHLERIGTYDVGKAPWWVMIVEAGE